MRFYQYCFFLILKIFSLALFIGVNAQISYGIPRPPPLTNGMSYNEVIKLWGSPDERSERETKREDTWFYKMGKVEFRDGIVQSWGYADGSAIDKNDSADGASKVALSSPDGKESLQVDELLTEIMKSGSPDDSSGSSGTGGSLVNTPPVNMPGVSVPPSTEVE